MAGSAHRPLRLVLDTNVVVAGAELIVTGDRKHLLPIGSHHGIAIAIVTAREVVDRLAAADKP